MRILIASPIPPATRAYWALGGTEAAFAAIDRALSDGRMPLPEAAHIVTTLPLVALEEAAARTRHQRLWDALNEPEYQNALFVALSFLPHLEETLTRGAVQYWLRLAWEAAGRHRHAVPPDAGAILGSTELHGITDDLRLPHRALHLSVPPTAGLELADSNGALWTATDILLVEEPTPARVWRICLEALTAEGRTAHIVNMALPSGLALNEAVALHVGEHRWHPLWTWTLGAVLSMAPRPSSRA
ncbi:hypothetical protein HUA74_44020 [Myxococcus sp. CA051A]|uniref:hypothetical protein n=1 Tax=Myxococcus sp. CA051A TaxID=2741739 RepID=UPI00157B0EA1|nr:hypothetical protein [Myxococcus sp. CA051A]NTX67637.1 hypothetical protein [Myxococcus sp. CA051A]